MSLDICSLTLADPANSLQDGRKHTVEAFLCQSFSAFRLSHQGARSCFLDTLAEPGESQSPGKVYRP